MHLKNPKYGNSFRLDTGLLIHDLLDSDVQIFQPTDRPIVEGFQVSFDAMSDQEKDRFVAFVLASAGELITLKDHEGTVWEGMITDDRIVIRENRGCRWEAGFSFEGRRLG